MITIDLQSAADRFADEVADYLRPYQDRLERYSWPMNERALLGAERLALPFKQVDGGVADTHALRAVVAQRAREIHLIPEPNRTSQLNELCEFVICEWGALDNNGQQTIAGYARKFTSARIPDLSQVKSWEDLKDRAGCKFTFSGISSWSKWLNFVWNDWALIYDARTAFSLNAIHFLRSIDAPVFPVPQGRGRLLSSFDSQSMASLRYLKARGNRPPDPKDSNEDFVAWLDGAAVPKNAAYVYYLQVMRGTSKRLGHCGEHALVETEMLLFDLSIRELVRDFITSLNNLIVVTHT
ncbi:hypothetical protein [Duganella sp. S19_KUP01_CR8]|uniref:hypothetical protein n=1 Tax=Duganella sp. S19_KUP01_CR8 TaxID=3025502 RepID=UPI002FCD8A53